MLSIQSLTPPLQITHAGHCVIKFGARSTRLVTAGVQRLKQLGDFGFNVLDTASRRLQFAALGLSLTGQFGDTTMRNVQLPLCIFAVLLRHQQVVAETCQTMF